MSDVVHGETALFKETLQTLVPASHCTWTTNPHYI